MNNQNLFNHILLEQEQQELLELVAEAARNMPRDRRQKFHVLTHIMDNGAAYSLWLPGVGKDGKNVSLGNVYMGDVEELDRQGLVALSRSAIDRVFDVTPLGFQYYDYLKRRIGEPSQRVERTISSYVEADNFRKKYPLAYQRWNEAEAKLWSSDAENEFTTIGHLCREAMQEFAHTLTEMHKPQDVTPDKTKTVARIKTVLSQKEQLLSTTEKPFLEALLAFWGTVSDLVQRQEHGGQKEGQPLMWEDARRVVFQTLVVMYEIDRAL